MLGMDLSTLNGAQLRRVLEVARARNQTELAAQLLSELHARRMHGQAWRGPPAGAGQAPPAEVWWEDLRHEAELPPAPPPRRSPVILGAVVAALIAAALGWQLTAPYVLQERNSAPPGPPASAPPAAPKPVPAAPEAPAKVMPAAPVGRAVSSASLKTPGRAARRAPPTARASAERSTNPVTASCRANANPADQLVCGYPALAARDRQMRQAFAQALAAGADARTIRRAQAEWRAVRDRTTDRDRLAVLYARRIRELEAGAAAARAGLPEAVAPWRADGESLARMPPATIRR